MVSSGPNGMAPVKDSDGRLRLALVLESLGSGGAERQAVELARRLDRSLYDLRLVCYTKDDFYGPLLDELGIPVVRLGRRARWDLRPCIRLARWLRRGEVDVLHGFLVVANFYCVVARALARRGAAIVSERSDPARNPVVRRALQRIATRRAEVVTANSLSSQAKIADRLSTPDKVLCIPNGIDLSAFSPVDRAERNAIRQRLGWREDQRIVLTVASYQYAKNHDGIAEALEGLAGEDLGLRFHWVGAPAPRVIFEAVCTRLRSSGLEGLVTIHEPREDIAALYRACDVLLLNSHFEGTPNVVLEAMACGRPVVATDVSDVARYVIPGRTGWLVKPGDAGDLRGTLFDVSQATSAVLDDYGAAGRARLLELGIDWDSVVHRYDSLYQSVAAQRSVHRGPG